MLIIIFSRLVICIYWITIISMTSIFLKQVTLYVRKLLMRSFDWYFHGKLTKIVRVQKSSRFPTWISNYEMGLEGHFIESTITLQQKLQSDSHIFYELLAPRAVQKWPLWLILEKRKEKIEVLQNMVSSFSFSSTFFWKNYFLAR